MRPQRAAVVAWLTGGTALFHAPVGAGPVTFVTALPVPKEQAVVRG